VVACKNCKFAELCRNAPKKCKKNAENCEFCSSLQICILKNSPMIPLFEMTHRSRQKILSMFYLFYLLFLAGVAGQHHDIRLKIIARRFSLSFLKCFEMLISHYLEHLCNDSQGVLLESLYHLYYTSCYNICK
jgi:hypothetical protein